MTEQNEQNNQEEKTMGDEIKGKMLAFYIRIEDWMRPSKKHPVLLQVLIFILKLPVLLLLLALSPVVLVILLFVFMAVL